MKLKWLGHASWKVKAGGKTIYIDPYQGDYDEEADLILSTHSHQDHCDPEKIRRVKGNDTVIIAPADCASKIGAPVRSLKPEERAGFDGVTVEAVEAYNYKRFRSPGNPFHPRGLGVGYIIRAEGKTLYHAGDTDFIPEMEGLEGIDLALLPSGGTYTMDNDEAAEAAFAIHPKSVVPMHIWDTDPGVLKRKVESESDIRVVALRPGETIEA
ncbi:MAG: MBL fold metallo-hydrolase [Candidatus Bathyarchaeota archaeon]|nr:MBL fold metallo-hydrolase [Candidatus Bathyarchaeota archaeon]